MDDLFQFADREPSDRRRRGGRPEREVLTVTALTRKIRNLLELRVGEVWVEGEISNLRKQASGHQYFTLKDSGAQISCVLFRGDARQLAAPLADGAQVQLFGSVSVYEPRGNYQIIARVVQEKGLGALQAKFEALKRRLAGEGLFDEAKKKPLAKFPRRVCLVTSPSAAALQDMLNVLGRRSPWLEVHIYPVRVQGREAAGEIAAALGHLAAGTGLPRFDTVVLARGGGSLEDLWPFNEERVARAIDLLDTPVVSAVGHEIDFTISDFAADLRAPTPSAAAELIAPDAAELGARLEGARGALRRLAERALERWRERVDGYAKSALLREPARALADREQGLDWLSERLAATLREALSDRSEQLAELRQRLALRHPLRVLESIAGRFDLAGSRLAAAAEAALRDRRERVAAAGTALRTLGPDSVLARGYSLTQTADGELVTSPDQAPPGTHLRTRLAGGEIDSTAIERA